MSRPAVLPDSDWHEQAVDMIEHLALNQATVTSEDLRRVMEAPEHANQIGGPFKTAHARRIIEPIGYRPSRDKSRRGGGIRVWALHPRLRDRDV